MLNLLDGPAQGSFFVHRAPYFLRAVVKSDMLVEGEKDVLDQPEDQPAADERVFVYRLDTSKKIGQMFIDGQKIRGQFVMADYHYIPDVDGEALRGTATWQKWCIDRAKKEGLNVSW